MSQEDPRAVIIDDVQLNIALLRKMLASFGITSVESTTDPRQAVALVRSFDADLVLLDLHMPGMSGLDVLTALHASAEEYLPVVVLTAEDTPEAKQTALSMGAHDFISKPFDRFEIDFRIRNLLRTRWLYLRLREHAESLQEHIWVQERRQAQLAEQRRHAVERVSAVLAGSGMHMHFQPIVSLHDHAGLVGVEALARFTAEPRRTPDLWFAEAADVGLGLELELTAVGAALAELPHLPPQAYLSINMSAETAISPQVAEMLTGSEPERILVELTEHARVEDYGLLVERLDVLRAAGVRLAVDDTGAGFSSLRHILWLRPDVIKLDLDLTRGVDVDPARRALAAALLSFAAEIGGTVVAEGVETVGELDALRELGVEAAQGYYLGRPQALPLDAVPASAVAALASGEPGMRARGVAGGR